MNLSSEILTAAAWVQEQINKEAFAEIGFVITVHGGEIRKTSYSMTIKKNTPKHTPEESLPINQAN